MAAAKANAVVALRQNGVIIWSWHIWVTAFDPDAPGANIYTYNNGDPMYLMDRNLGATADRNDTEQNRLKSVGLYYQGGRKDPFPPLATIPASQQAAPALSNHKPVYPSNDIFKVEPFSPGNDEQTLVRTIENPTTFISGSAKPYDWYSFNEQSARWMFYHNDNSNPKEQNTYIVAKNSYDPCPEGWIVPNSYTKAPWRPQIWGGLGTGGSFLPDGNTDAIPGNFGIITPAGDFYPAAGYVDHTDGTYREVGYNVLVTSSHFTTYNEYNQLSVLEYPVGRAMSYTDYPYATGRNIRCMKIDYYKPEND
ncbi:MAG: hypothetical protein LUD68_09355 [Rikenellaceae bacterium]|nr:hypothetical protein [Rikenellaceae bacterium]